jgi:23S rRNA pseudouridine1911/1915/1917 synthase
VSPDLRWQNFLMMMVFVVVMAALAPSRCPSCGQPLSAAKVKRHMAFCAPDLLDPQGWAQGDRAVVLRHIRAKHRKSSPEFRALSLRFGAKTTSQQELAQKMSWSPRRTRDTISKFLHSIPPVADSDEQSLEGLEVLFEDEALIAVNKPAGVGVTPDHRWRGGSMLNLVLGHLQRQAEGEVAATARARAKRYVPSPCHRLDLNTSGVLVFAKTADAATALMGQFERRLVQKEYAALCMRRPRTGQIDAPICRVAGVDHCERRVCAPGEEADGQSASSTIEVIAEAPHALAADDLEGGSLDGQGAGGAPCLVRVSPAQGRTHQVRVHCLAAGAPILADDLYGGDGAAKADGAAADLPIQRHALHALHLRCAHPVTGEPLELHAPLARDMADAARQLRIEVPPEWAGAAPRQTSISASQSARDGGVS